MRHFSARETAVLQSDDDLMRPHDLLYRAALAAERVDNVHSDRNSISAPMDAMADAGRISIHDDSLGV
jgi:hypothetical protein